MLAAIAHLYDFVTALAIVGIMVVWPFQMALRARRRGEDPAAAARSTVTDRRMAVGLAFGFVILAQSLSH